MQSFVLGFWPLFKLFSISNSVLQTGMKFKFGIVDDINLHKMKSMVSMSLY